MIFFLFFRKTTNGASDRGAPLVTWITNGAFTAGAPLVSGQQQDILGSLSVTPQMKLAIIVIQLLPFPAMCYDIPSVVGFSPFCILVMSCISYHVIICIAFAYVFVSYIRASFPLSVLQSGAPMSPGVPFYISSGAGIKHSRIGARFDMWPRYP